MLNLTPHAIVIATANGDITIEPSGTVARVDSNDVVIGKCSVTGVDIIERAFGEVYGLPNDDDTICIVSAMVLSAVPNRKNTFAPDTGATAIRNEKGHIVKVTRLVKA